MSGHVADRRPRGVTVRARGVELENERHRPAEEIDERYEIQRPRKPAWLRVLSATTLDSKQRHLRARVLTLSDGERMWMGLSSTVMSRQVAQ